MKENPHLRAHGRGYRARRQNRVEPRQRFLIVCEGEKTEPNYFRRFPIPGDSVVDVRWGKASTRNLVREAIRLRDQDDGRYDQVWCVFDRDDFTAENFNAALNLAHENGIQCAYSNQAFELWYVLHFEYLSTGVPRTDYIAMLEDKKQLGHYAKNSPTLYDELLSFQPTAIRNAERLLLEYQPSNPYADDPSTTVHCLVKELNRLFLYR